MITLCGCVLYEVTPLRVMKYHSVDQHGSKWEKHQLHISGALQVQDFVCSTFRYSRI